MANSLPHPISLVAEGGGFTLTCSGCQWTRFYPSRAETDPGRIAHAAKCKGPKVKTEAAPKRARSIGWDDREGATWIDSM